MSALRKQSTWAQRNPGKPRAFIVLTKLMLISLAVFLGISMNGTIPVLLQVLSIVGFLASVAYYPKRHAKSGFFRFAYARQKVLDLLLCVSSFILILSWMNHEAVILSNDTTHVRQLQEYHVTNVVFNVTRTNQKKANRQLKRQRRKEFKKQFFAAVKKFRNDLSPGVKIALSILATAVLLIVFFCHSGLELYTELQWQCRSCCHCPYRWICPTDISWHPLVQRYIRTETRAEKENKQALR